MAGTYQSSDPLIGTLPDGVRDQVAVLLKERRKVEAIKVLREAAGCGLAEAKQAVDRFEAEIGAAPPGGRGAGCTAGLLALVLLAAVVLLLGCAATSPRPDAATLARQVADTERAFAKTMADRDFAAFQSFLSEEAVFFGGSGALRGKAAVAERWKRLYEAPQAPFSWEPKEVEVLPSGELALTSGPVFDPSGKEVGTFTSIWRLEAPGTWRIIFDKGCDACECPEKKG